MTAAHDTDPIDDDPASASVDRDTVDRDTADRNTADRNTSDEDTSDEDTAPIARHLADGAPWLALDTASPVVSVALGTSERLWASRTIDLKRSAERLLATVDEVLSAGGTRLESLRGIAVLRGPGSFTGLRVGLGTVLGLHQALGVPATAIDTLPVLARAGAARLAETADAERSDGGDPAPSPPYELIAAVDALRGEWMACSYSVGPDGPSATGVPRLLDAKLLATRGLPVVAFGAAALAAAGIETLEPGPLAPFALAQASDVPWTAESLVQPIYFRPPAVTLPKPRSRQPQSAPRRS